MKKIYEEKQFLSKVKEGVAKIANTVSSTYGPYGKNVALADKGGLLVTKDGVTVAKFFETEDEVENLAAKLIKDASIQTNSDVGDGTTTSVVLASALYESLYTFLYSGYKVKDLLDALDLVSDKVLKFVNDEVESVSSIDQIKQISTVAANGEERIAELIAEAIDTIGNDGAITIQESSKDTVELEILEGYKIDSGYMSEIYINDESTRKLKLADCFLLVTDNKISNMEELQDILILAVKAQKPIVIVADEIKKNVLAWLIANHANKIDVYVLNPPSFGQERKEWLSDLALVTGAFYFTSTSKEIKRATLADLGQVGRLEASKYETFFINGNGDQEEISTRIEGLQVELKNEKDERLSKRIFERINRLSSGAAVLWVGGKTRQEMIERKYRVEDALQAAYSALRGGLLAGGGTTLHRAVDAIRVDVTGLLELSILMAFRSPFNKLLINSGQNIPNISFDKNEVLNLVNFKKENAYESGIIDAALVTKSAIKNAVSVVKTIINLGYMVIDND